MLTYIFVALGALMLLLFLIVRNKHSGTKAIVLKTVTSLCFVACALMAIAENAKLDLLPAQLLVVFGLVAGLLGDITLDLRIYFQSKADVMPQFKTDSENMTFVGMSSFGMGHVAYIAAAVLVSGNYKALIWSGLVAVALATITMLVTTKVLKMQFGKFFFISAAYAFLLAYFAAYCFFTLNSSPCAAHTACLVVGAVCFVVSDLILSTTYFSHSDKYNKSGALNPESRLFIVTNHVTYYVAQFAIALSLLFI